MGIFERRSIEEVQLAFSRSRDAEYLPSPAESKLGFALSTKSLIPINGLRHPPEGDTNGWYVWCGEQYSQAPDFFQALHAQHVYEEYPQLIELLGLPPGYRFLSAGDHLDVWFDSTLLDTHTA